MRKLRHSIIALTLTICQMTVYGAEPLTVQNFEGEAKIGFTMPLGGYHQYSNCASFTFGIEGRYNITDTPWDCGLLLQLDAAGRDFDDGKVSLTQTNRTLTCAVTGEYNFRQGRRVNPFVSLALGIGRYDQVGDNADIVSPGVGFVCMPRVGVELFHHVRLTAHCLFVRHGFTTAGLSVGFVIGGRPKTTD